MYKHNVILGVIAQLHAQKTNFIIYLNKFK